MNSDITDQLDAKLSDAIKFAKRTRLDLSEVKKLESVIKLKHLADEPTKKAPHGNVQSSEIKQRNPLKNKGVFTLLTVSIIAVGVGLKKETIAGTLGYFMGYNDHRGQCSIAVPSSWKDNVRPPVNCAICENITSVDRISNLDPEEFFQEYVEKGRPAVITDGMKNWTAQDHFSYEFFRELYTEDDSHFMDSFEDAGCQFFPYKTEFRSLREVFEMDENRAAMQDGYKPWYVGWGSCDVEVNQVLRKYYQRPYFLPRTSEGTKMDWIFMGTPGFGAHMHVDHVSHPSWQAQIKGEKLWSLQPPPECYFKCVDMEVVVKAGDIIVLDTNRWYHSTTVASDDVSITIGSEFD